MLYQDKILYIEFESNNIEEMRGSIKSKMFKPVPFEGLNQLFVYFDRLGDLGAMPQSSTIKRKFSVEEAAVPVFEENSEGIVSFKDGCTHVSVVVEYRQNASWQGFVLDGENKLPFKSELEFLKIIEKAH